MAILLLSRAIASRLKKLANDSGVDRETLIRHSLNLWESQRQSKALETPVWSRLLYSGGAAVEDRAAFGRVLYRLNETPPFLLGCHPNYLYQSPRLILSLHKPLINSLGDDEFDEALAALVEAQAIATRINSRLDSIHNVFHDIRADVQASILSVRAARELAASIPSATEDAKAA